MCFGEVALKGGGGVFRILPVGGNLWFLKVFRVPPVGGNLLFFVGVLIIKVPPVGKTYNNYYSLEP